MSRVPLWREWRAQNVLQVARVCRTVAVFCVLESARTVRLYTPRAVTL